MTQNQKSKAKQKPQFSARKKAFDAVLEAYRSAKDVGIGAVAIGDGGKGVSNPVKPSLTDLRCDVDRVINKCVPAEQKALRLRFMINALASVMFERGKSP